VMIIHSLTPVGHDRLYNVVYGKDGKIYAVGQYSEVHDLAGDFETVVARMNADGSLDTTFGAGGFVVRNVVQAAAGELFRGLGLQSDGKVVISGAAEHLGTDAAGRDRDVFVLRFNTDGSTDASFGDNGVLTLDLSTGQNRDGNVAPAIATYASDGNFSLAIDASDRIVLECTMVRPGTSGATADTDAAIVRLTKDGAFDTSFGTNGIARVDVLLSTNGATIHNDASPRNVTVLPDGSIIGAGYQPVPGKDTSPVIFKLTANGQLDTSFGDQGVFHQTIFDEQTECYKAVVQPIAGSSDYKLVTTGYGRDTEAQTTDIVSLRLNSNGTLDTTYGTGGAVRIDVGGFADNSRNLVVLPDRRILLVGGGRPVDTANVDGFIGLLLPDGQPDTSFGPKGWKTIDLGGPSDFLWGVALAPDAKTAAIVGIKGVGNQPSTNPANDDTAVVLLPL
jgi:uncharacterized delta-60 repeat protein